MDVELTLPRGRRARVHVTAEDGGFAGALRLLATLEVDGRSFPAEDLALADFHVLRAFLMHGRALREEPITITCKNCAAEIQVVPCQHLEIAPWVDGEIGDEELDLTLPFGEPIDVPPIALGKVRIARTVTFAERTVRQAMPLLVRPSPPIDRTIVEAMGLVALGPEADPARIASALRQADADAWDAIAAAYLDGHYPARLGSAWFCDDCGARNDVDAPYERELAFDAPRTEPGALPPFAGLTEFAEKAHAIFAPLARDVPGDEVVLVVDDATPAVDDGGEPLLGSYVPPHPGDASAPTRPPTVTVYFRTFRAIAEDEGPYDWEDELTETIEHELEHHVFFLRGDDPMDEEEHAEIDREALRIVGKREASRRVVRSFGDSVADFARKTWPLWVLVLGATALTICSSR